MTEESWAVQQVHPKKREETASISLKRSDNDKIPRKGGFLRHYS